MLLSGPSLFFYKHRLSKNTIEIGVSALFLKNKIARKNFKCYYLVQVGVFKDAPNLDQIITIKNVFFFVIFCFEKCAQMPIFIVFCEKQPKICQKKAPPKNDNFSHFAKHRFIKKNPLCCNPPFDQKLVFFNLGFLKPKTMMLNKNKT